MGKVELKPRILVDVIVPRPILGPLTYELGAEWVDLAKPGAVALVPFRSAEIEGLVLRVYEEPRAVGLKPRSYEIKKLSSIPFSEAVFGEHDLDFFKWISEYYQLPLGEVLHSALPKAVLNIPKRQRKESATVEQELSIAHENITLTKEQSSALSAIDEKIAARVFHSFLLYGVTGSGKTEVYIRAAEHALSQGKTALVLVPEIALTPQLRARFESHFGNNVAVLHSSLGDQARRNYWWAIQRGDCRVVVGARSAVFAPLRNIGLIVVDEEHEPSYKQEDRLRYNARDLALVRAKQHGAVAILGSATPSIESYYSALSGKYTLLRLGSRPMSRPMPEVTVVDMRSEPKDFEQATKSSRPILSNSLRQAISETLENHEQSIVFVNRKGFSSFLMCGDCGEVPKCLNCSVSLTYYKARNELHCHYCGLQMPMINQCGKCQSKDVKFMGLGTELVEAELRRLYPEARIERVDAETVTTAKKLQDILDRVRAGSIDILVGTQMLAKGHDFPNVTLVGLVLADMNLHLPDFRAGERTFQLVTQVAGRAGRGDKPGRVILQTMMPEHYVIATSADQNFEAFYSQEVVFRKEFGYPPYSKMAQLEFRHLKESEAQKQAFRAQALLEHIRKTSTEVDYLGPTAASIARIANQFRWQLLLRSEKTAPLNAVIKTLRKDGVRFIDVDPVSTL